MAVRGGPASRLRMGSGFQQNTRKDCTSLDQWSESVIKGNVPFMCTFLFYNATN